MIPAATPRLLSDLVKSTRALSAEHLEPGRGTVLMAMQTQILLRLGRRNGSVPLMSEALNAVRAAGVSNGKFQPFDKFVPDTERVNP